MGDLTELILYAECFSLRLEHLARIKRTRLKFLSPKSLKRGNNEENYGN